MQCTFETKPLKLKADYAVTLKVEPIEAIYDSVSIKNFNYQHDCLSLRHTAVEGN